MSLNQYIVIAVALAMGAVALAKKKNRKEMVWFWLTLFMPLGILIILVLRPKGLKKDSHNRRRKMFVPKKTYEDMEKAMNILIDIHKKSVAKLNELDRRVKNLEQMRAITNEKILIGKN